MELQAIRYAAMVSTLTFDKAVSIFDGYLKRTGSESAQEPHRPTGEVVRSS